MSLDERKPNVETVLDAVFSVWELRICRNTLDVAIIILYVIDTKLMPKLQITVYCFYLFTYLTIPNFLEIHVDTLSQKISWQVPTHHYLHHEQQQQQQIANTAIESIDGFCLPISLYATNITRILPDLFVRFTSRTICIKRRKPSSDSI